MSMVDLMDGFMVWCRDLAVLALAVICVMQLVICYRRNKVGE